MLYPSTAIQKLESLEAYFEGGLVELRRLKKELSNGEVKKSKQPISQEEMNRASARLRKKLMAKHIKNS